MGVGIFRFLLVLAAATLGSTLLFLRNRRDLGEKTKAIEKVLLVELFITLLYLAENVAPSVGGKVFWDSAQLAADALIGPAYLTFAFRYSGRRLPRFEGWLIRLSAGLGVVAFVYLVVGHSVGFARETAHLSGTKMLSLRYDFELIDYLVFTNFYFLLLTAIFLHFGSGALRNAAFRHETLLLGAGVFLPSMLGVLAFASVSGERDLSPFYFGLGALFTAFGVLSGKIVTTSPLARDLLVEAQSDAIFLTSDGRIIDANLTAKELLEDPGLLGKTVSELLPESLASEKENIVLTRNARHWEFRRHELPGKQTLLVGRDVTDQRHLEEALERTNTELERQVERRGAELSKATESLKSEVATRLEAEDRALANAGKFRAIFDNSAFLLALLDRDGKLLELNRSGSELLQLSSNRAEGLVFSALSLWSRHPEIEAEIARHHAEAVAGNVGVFEIEIPDDPRKVLDCRTKPFRGEGGETLVLFEAQDVTTLRELDENRAHLQHMLAHADRMDMLGRLAGGVAHDFNNLLTVILGAAELLATTAKDDEDRGAAEEILAAAEQASLVTRQLLAFSRVGGTSNTRLDAHSTLQHLSKIYARLLGEKHSLELALHAKLSTVELVPGHLEQCLTNLIVNARDAMPKGGRIIVETSISHAPERRTSGDYLRISVRDKGMGLPPNLRDKVFDAFFTTKAEGKGTGLGLHTVQTLVNESNGFVELESEVGRGSTFSLYFPLVSTDARIEETAAAPVRLTGNETLFLVEDLAPLRQRMSRELRRLGYDLLSFESAEAAFEAFSDPVIPKPTALVTDVMLPGEDGTWLAGRLRENSPEIPVIFTTGYAGDREALLESSPNTFLLYKPYRIEQLATLVRTALDRSHEGALRR